MWCPVWKFEMVRVKQECSCAQVQKKVGLEKYSANVLAFCIFLQRLGMLPCVWTIITAQRYSESLIFHNTNYRHCVWNLSRPWRIFRQTWTDSFPALARRNQVWYKLCSLSYPLVRHCAGLVSLCAHAPFLFHVQHWLGAPNRPLSSLNPWPNGTPSSSHL